MSFLRCHTTWEAAALIGVQHGHLARGTELNSTVGGKILKTFIKKNKVTYRGHAGVRLKELLSVRERARIPDSLHRLDARARTHTQKSRKNKEDLVYKSRHIILPLNYKVMH